MNNLELTLSAPLQAYCDNPYFMDYHGTEYYPTRSAIIGMFACAMGIKREDMANRHNEFSELQIYVERVKKTPKILTDFQTVSPVRTTYLAYKKGEVVIEKTSDKLLAYDGTKCETGETKTVQKEYIVDQKFKLHVFSENEERLEQLKLELERPMYPLYLGRKCCVPTEEFYPKIVESEIDKSWKKL